MLAILAFAVYLPIFPTGGYVNFSDDPLGWLQHLLLPWIVLALLNAAYYTRLTRAHMLDELQQDYMRTALAKGMPRTKVITRHALPNVMLPVLTMFGLDLGGLLREFSLCKVWVRYFLILLKILICKCWLV